MTQFYPLLGPLALWLAAWWIDRGMPDRKARMISLSAAGVSLVATLAPGLVLRSSLLPAAIAATGLVAVALSPLVRTGPGAFAGILQVLALSLLATLGHNPLVVAIMGAGTAWPVWRELRAHEFTRGLARAFALYLGSSAALMILGALLSSQGYAWPAVGVVLVGLAIRMGLVPLHSWLPALVESAPIGLSVAFLAPGVGLHLLSLVAHGFPGQTLGVVSTIAVVSALFAAAMGAGQSSARRSLAYLLMSQSALLVVGGLESAGDPPGPWLLVQVAIAGFAMAIAGLEARRGPLSLDRPSGNFARLPRLATAFLVLGLAIAGFPGTIGYVAIEHLTGEAGSLSIALRMALLAATALNAIAVLRGFFMLFMGTAQHQGEQDTTRRESLVFSALMAAVVLAGVWPAITWLPSTLSSPWVGHPDFQRITDRPTR